MNQQINLYQPIFREERKLFSFKTVGIALGMVALSLIAMWALGAHNVNKMADAVVQLKAQQAAQQQMAQSAGLLLDAQGSPAQIQAQVQTLSAQLADHTNALALLQSGAAGEPKGFAHRLQALARQHTEGVWLDELLMGGANGLALRGHSVSPELIPKYLQLLTSEPELSGALFNEVVIDRRERHDDLELPMSAPASSKEREAKAKSLSPTVRFSVSSNGILNQLTFDAAKRQGS
jgi:hypothetical protein